MRLPLAVSLVTLITIFILVTYQTSRLPTPTRRAHIAYTRLQEITRQAHPYNSYNNDAVRRYLKTAVHEVCPSAKDVSDNSTKWIPRSQKVPIATYFEQTNLVIAIDSSKEVEQSILLSAHYDSVASGNGATDNGMGVTVLLSLVERYCKHSLQSNLIFNFNNAEEDGLFGAQAFLDHPLFSSVKSFVNLEGAGAGGPAMLFRASGAEVAAAYKGSKLPRSSIVGNDFFAQKIVQSETDFVVYDEHIPGLDIAFYSPRSQYHTRRDTTRTTSAWSIEHMLSAAETSMLRLASMKSVVNNQTQRPMFFDFLGLFFYSTTLRSLLFLDLAILITSPILLGISFSIRSFFGKIKFVGLGRTLLALIMQIALVVGLSVVIVGFNPFIIHSSPLLYSATLLLGSFSANLLSTRLLVYRVKEQHDLSRVMSWELCIIWYILLFAFTIVSLVKGFGSTYIVTLNFLAALVVALVSLFERSAYIPPVANFQGLTDTDQESTESSPLLRRDPLAPEIEDSIAREKRARDYRSGTTWIIKYLVLIPVPALVCLWLLYSTILPGLTQTLPDGTNGITIYAIVGFFSILTFFNLAPFFLSTSLSSAFPAFLLLLVILTLTSMLKAPFDVKAPLKLYMKQVVDFQNDTSMVQIEGLPGYMQSAVSVLSLAQEDLSCTKGASRSSRLDTCTFPVPVNERLAKHGIKTSFDKKSAIFTIDAIDSRICDVKFDKQVRITSINSLPINSRDSHFRAFRRNWTEPFSITLDTRPSGIVTCFWDDRSEDRIEAFDRIESELPDWAELVKRETGLLQFSDRI